MMKAFTLLTTFMLISLCSPGQHKTYDVTTYGAVGDGHTLNTRALQKAIDAAERSGGGVVVIPRGRFLTGSLLLGSHIELHLAAGAVLLGSTDPYDYPYMAEVLNHTPHDARYAGGLLQARNATSVTVSGPGTIDGQGRALALRIDSLFYAGKLDSVYYDLRRKRPDRRPGILMFVHCEHVAIRDVTLKNSAFWVQTYRNCRGLDITGVRVESDAYWNNDGIDIVDCHRVRVTRCFVNSADDGICLKSETPGMYNDSILISDCTIRSSASAVKFGTASVGGFRNVTIRDIRVFDTFRSAIALESVDGGFLENILVDGVDAVNTGNPVFIRLAHRNTNGPVGTLRHVVIRNMRVEVPLGRPDLDYELRGPALDFFHNTFPSSVAGLPGHPVQDVTLEDIEITYPGGGNDGLAFMPLYRLGDVPENAAQYPEFSMFGELPAWGFYVRHVEGLTLKNVYVKAEKPDYRPAFVFDDVKGLSLLHVQTRETPVEKKQYILRNVQDARLLVNPAQVDSIP